MCANSTTFRCEKLTVHSKNEYQGTLDISCLPSHQPLLFSNFLRRVIFSECPQLGLRVGFCGTWGTDFLSQTTLVDFVYSNFFFKKRNNFAQKSLGELGFVAGNDVFTLTKKINQLPLIYGHLAENFTNKTIRLCVQGPGQIRAAQLHFPPGLSCLTPNTVLGEISDSSILEIHFLLQVTPASISTWNAYHIGYKALETGQNRAKGTNQLNLWGETLYETEIFPTDTRKAYYRGIILAIHDSKQIKLNFVGSLNNDFNQRLPRSMKRLAITLSKLKDQSISNPLLVPRQ